MRKTRPDRSDAAGRAAPRPDPRLGASSGSLGHRRPRPVRARDSALATPLRSRREKPTRRVESRTEPAMPNGFTVVRSPVPVGAPASRGPEPGVVAPHGPGPGPVRRGRFDPTQGPRARRALARRRGRRHPRHGHGGGRLNRNRMVGRRVGDAGAEVAGGPAAGGPLRGPPGAGARASGLRDGGLGVRNPGGPGRPPDAGRDELGARRCRAGPRCPSLDGRRPPPGSDAGRCRHRPDVRERPVAGGLCHGPGRGGDDGADRAPAAHRPARGGRCVAGGRPRGAGPGGPDPGPCR